MGLLGKFFGRKREPLEEGIEIVSRHPVASFHVESVLRIGEKVTIIGTVEGGMVYPGYKVKGKKNAALVYIIEKDRKRVEYAVDGDKVALILEGRIETKKGDTLEVYQS
ncbi:tRNA-binding protein Pbp11 [Thermococcus sp. Bubb.Bath]|uniref:tRNA-binding protein Pbp11 n=1 Tax=Thermococcus sp. Bubb.Bath TaxID=1638242 RepID=UPI001439F793|nr:tRNA-binding protein Pbp11 [Thermococcus sp. Bubb.Bath]NJF24330.1 translation factor [Thermococcus sp. Bubb.Bath]